MCIRDRLLPEAKQENDKKTAVVAKASDAENDNGTYIQKDHSEQQPVSYTHLDVYKRQ